MGNYIMTDIRIHKVDNTNSNRIEGIKRKPEDDFYIKFYAVNMDNSFEQPVELKITGSDNPFIIRTFRKLFPVGKDKNGEDWNGLNTELTPEQVAVFDPNDLPEAVRKLPPTTRIVPVPMPGLFLMKYNNDEVDKDGIPMRGQWLKARNGLVKIYQKSWMLVIYKRDEDTGELKPANGWDTKDRIKDYCERNCFPISKLYENADDPNPTIDEAYDPRAMAEVKHPGATEETVREAEHTASSEAEGLA